ncbi:hypothetical protein [Variovorax sp. MHTC-1]|uniref:hypothetical protein n=1 Tax=Variovorax sp. MHTC-1 TaxID=2495593 RepID=UPI000F87FCF1|nr:hypothetical protein [Variovorax sp. MHTC-1]RST53880.1 hypothetical protein EJI01_13430 [Variovorax sp. MHTC-1]
MKFDTLSAAKNRTRVRSPTPRETNSGVVSDDERRLLMRKKAGFWIFVLPFHVPHVTSRQVKDLLEGRP